MEEKDRKFAQSIQNMENKMQKKLSEERLHESMLEMLQTNLGKAILLVERVIRFVESSEVATDDKYKFAFKAVAKDVMVEFAERLLAKQDEFKAKKAPFKIDIGYHYTNEDNMSGIQANGLMTKKDRIKNKIKVSTHGSVFGDGVYTANNPTSFMDYGSVGIIVARIQGKPTRIAKSTPTPTFDSKKHKDLPNTIIGDKTATSLRKWPKSDSRHEIVLRESSQCVPLIRYDQSPLLGSQIDGAVAHLGVVTESLKSIVDEVFNGMPPSSKKVWFRRNNRLVKK